MNTRLWNRNFTLLTFSNFLMSSAYYSLISTLPVYISSELHALNSIVGLVMASYLVSSVLIRPFCGYSLDRFGRKTIFISAVILYALIFNTYLIVWTIPVMILVRFSHGLTWGVTTTSNSTIAIDIIPYEKRGQGIGYFGVSTTLGMVLGPVIGSYVFQLGGYSAMFLAGFGLGLISAVLAASVRYPAFVPVKNIQPFGLKQLFEPTTLLLCLNLFLIMITYGGLLSFIALYGKEIGIHNASGFFLVYAIGIISARFSSGKVFDRNGPKKILLPCLLLLIIGFPVLALVKNPAGFYGSAIILGFGNGVVFPTFQAMTNNMVPQNRRGIANSTLFTAVDLGMGTGMILVGGISQKFSLSAAFMTCSVIAVVALAFFLVYSAAHYRKFTVKGETA